MKSDGKSATPKVSESKEPVSTKIHRGKVAEECNPGDFEPESHFYPKVLNAQIHPLVLHFLNTPNERICARYLHRNPAVDAKALRDVLAYKPEHFRWAGSDLFKVTNEAGSVRPIIIETNSCPSGQKSMPWRSEDDEKNGYRLLIQKTFKPYLESQKDLIKGALGVIYDKNYMEASGYANTMADVFGEKIYLVESYLLDDKRSARWTKDLVLEIQTKDKKWIQLRAVFRYVTQKPWTRFPVEITKTLIINPVIACLSGGRNKLLADKAYEFFNFKYSEAGFQIYTPETIRDVSKAEVPLWVKNFGGHAVVKNPYSNAGQGVYTVTSKKELDAFMKGKDSDAYDQFIVQSLVGNSSWSSATRTGTYYHVGTIPGKKNAIFAADIRCMVHYDFEAGGMRPLALYSRRARAPLATKLAEGADSWEQLGTNLSLKKADGTWGSDTSRLMLMDRRDFNKLGLGFDDLVDCFIQTVFSVVAIDQLACRLIKAGKFNKEMFHSLNKDDALLAEINSFKW